MPSTESTPPHLSLKEVTALLVRHFDFHEGLFDLSLEMQFGFGAFGPSPESALPGAVVGVKAIGIVKADKAGPHTVDAAQVNPAAATKAKTRRSQRAG